MLLYREPSQPLSTNMFFAHATINTNFDIKNYDLIDRMFVIINDIPSILKKKICSVFIESLMQDIYFRFGLIKIIPVADRRRVIITISFYRFCFYNVIKHMNFAL